MYPAGVALRDSQSTKQTGYLCLTATLLRKTFKLFLNVNLQSAKHRQTENLLHVVLVHNRKVDSFHLGAAFSVGGL